MMTLVDDLRAARALIDTPRKWRKDGKLGGGRACAVNALIDASVAGETHGTEAALVSALGIDVNTTHKTPMHYRELIADFNDRPATTHADIMVLFDRAINAALASTKIEEKT